MSDVDMSGRKPHRTSHAKPKPKHRPPVRVPVRVPSQKQAHKKSIPAVLSSSPLTSRPNHLLGPYTPILSSLGIHAIVLLLALTTYTVGKQVVARTQEQLIVPDALIIEGAPVGGIPDPGLDGDPTRRSAGDDMPDHAAADAWKRPSKALESAVMSAAEDDSQSAGGAGGQRIASLGVGAGIGTDGGNPTPFGAPSDGGTVAPKSTFMGVSGNARKILYVCDASGSMVGLKFLALKAELEKSVRELVPIQSFNVIFFNDAQPIMLDRDLVVANSQNKSRLLAFLKGAAERRGSDPVPSLRYAMLQKPDLVYLLTDGDFRRDGDLINQDVLREIRWLNRENHVRFNTIGFPGGESEDQQSHLRMLKQIADDSGGAFRAVTTNDLNQSVR